MKIRSAEYSSSWCECQTDTVEVNGSVFAADSTGCGHCSLTTAIVYTAAQTITEAVSYRISDL